MNNKSINNTNSYIFNKNINNKFKLISFKKIRNEVGNIRYLPPISKEWKNNVYSFNFNNIKNLPIYDLYINNLIKGYFDSCFNSKFVIDISKSRNNKSINSSLNRIYVSKAELKHTNSKTVITIYTYNKERISLLKKIKGLKISFFKRILLLFYNSKNIYKNLSNNIFNEAIKSILYRELLLIRRYKLKLSLNKYKFEEKFIYILAKVLGKFYNKKIDFNIINLKSMILNSDVFTKILTLKLKSKKANPIRIMNFILNKAILPKVNRIKEKSSIIKSVDFNLLENKYKNLNLNYIIKNNFDQWLSELYNNIDSSENNTKLYDILFNSINYKNMSGIRLEVKGRLSKRYRADRALFKLKWKGGLKNIDSSYKKLSSVNMRGYVKPNVEYSVFTAKRRIGAFAAKGWISGKK